MVFGQFCALLILALASTVLVALVIPVVVRRAVRSRFVDSPEGRKDHARPVPPVGGIVIVPVFLAALPFLGFNPLHHISLYMGILVILITGVLDDYYDLKANKKLFLQIAVATMMATSGEAVLRDLGHLFGAGNALTLGPIAIPFTIVCFVFLMNAMNMIDGVDGLAGGLSFVMLFWLFVAALLGQEVWLAGILMVLIGCLAGFLVHNMRYPGHRRATVFLGDAGSMALGLLIAWLAINIAQAPTPGLYPIGVALIILVPILDSFALFIVRLRAGRRAFAPGHDHIHHRLIARGIPAHWIGPVLMGVMFVSGACGVLGPRFGLTEGLMTDLWVILLIGYTARLLIRGKTLYSD